MFNAYSIGKTIYLRPPEEIDLDSKWYQWFSDPNITKYLGDRYWPNTKAKQADFLKSLASSNNRLVLLICAIDTNEIIGVCNLSSINWISRHADIAAVIGESHSPSFTTAGLEAIKLLIEVAFQRLNLENLRSTHFYNHPFTPLMERLFGFSEVGRLKNFSHLDGELVDTVITQLSRSDWKKRNL